MRLIGLFIAYLIYCCGIGGVIAAACFGIANIVITILNGMLVREESMELVLQWKWVVAGLFIGTAVAILGAVLKDALTRQAYRRS